MGGTAVRVLESDLVLPALQLLEVGELSTTQLIRGLRDIVLPEGEDIELLEGRKDDKFSQKVRNLKSHSTLEREGYVTYERRGHQGYWKITDQGLKVVQSPREPLFALDETVSIVEGIKSAVNYEIYSRSKLVRDHAIFIRESCDSLCCEACDFDFKEVYGELGEGFIEIHHIVPISYFRNSSVEKSLSEAMTNVAALCSNCHRMIHRKRDYVLSVLELRDILFKTKTLCEKKVGGK
jgi:predicted HNH restriction endonuclease